MVCCFPRTLEKYGPINVKWSVKTTGGHEVETPRRQVKRWVTSSMQLIIACDEQLLHDRYCGSVQSGSDHPSVESQKLFLDSMTF